MRRLALLLAALVAGTLLTGSAPATADPAPVRILAIGDSITADGRWQAELDRLLTAGGVPHVIETEAVGGSKCNRWPTLMAGILTQHRPDLVVIYCGTNDGPDELCWGEPCTTWAMRSMVESAHARGALVLPTLIGQPDLAVAPQWLIDANWKTVDRLWMGMVPYLNAGWLAGINDLQKLPGNADYLGGDGFHPNGKGQAVIGRIVYESAAARMGWPAIAGPPLCGQHGHRRAYARPTFVPCP